MSILTLEHKDEAAFVEEDWFNRFARPLLMVNERRFTLVTTPPISQTSWFSVFISQIIESGDQSTFEYINHSLVCSECAERGLGERCLHKLENIPPWKSFKGLQALQQTVAKKDRKSFLEEVYGLVADSNTYFFPRSIIDQEFSYENTMVLTWAPDIIYVSIDPASHVRSSMGLAAIAYSDKRSDIILLASASIPVSSADVEKIVSLIDLFIKSLLSQRNCDTATLVPIIEVNHSDIVASSMLAPFRRRSAHFSMPFTRERFTKYITPGIGVMTTAKIKEMAVQKLRECFTDHRIKVSRSLLVPSATSFNPAALQFTMSEAIDMLKDQLAAFRVHDDGTISGKTSAGHDDDQAWALMQAIVWSGSLRELGK